MYSAWTNWKSFSTSMKQSQKWTDYRIWVSTYINKNKESFTKLQRHSAGLLPHERHSLRLRPACLSAAPRHRAAASVSLTAKLPGPSCTVYSISTEMQRSPAPEQCPPSAQGHCSASIAPHPAQCSAPSQQCKVAAFPAQLYFLTRTHPLASTSGGASGPQARVTLLHSASNGIMKCDFR